MMKFSIIISITSFLLFTACNIQEKSSATQEVSSSIASNREERIARKKSIGKTLKESEHLSVEERISLYHRLKEESSDLYDFENEDDMTMYGYSLLWRDRLKEALEIFKLIVSQFPDSSNPYDSLGEAYLALGEEEKALANYQKSLALNPENHNAIDQINRIKKIESPSENQREKAEDKFAKTFNAEAYKADLEALGNKLIEVHPNALKFISKEAFWKVIGDKKALMTDQTTYAEFAWHCSEIVANVNCSHTSTGGFFPEWEMLPKSLFFPLEVRWMSEGLFVVEAFDHNDKIAVKDEILSINGIAVDQLIKNIYPHLPSQGHIATSKRHDFNFSARGMIAYELNFPKSYELIIKDKETPIVLDSGRASIASFIEPFTKPCPENLCLEIIEEEKTAILSVASFNYYWWNNLDDFEEFMDKGFQEIQEKGIENLIVDVRFNGGGSFHPSIHLLRYLSNKPFTYYLNEGLEHPFDNHFKGNLYFLIDGNGSSTTGHFMAIAKSLNLGTIIGEELGSNQFCTAGQMICRLPNTELQYYVANSTVESSATSLPDETGILPDHYVTQSIDDYLNNVDTVKEYALQLIEK
ncbi:MAG: S41 family peptidase [Bacteroidota bacterium]